MSFTCDNCDTDFSTGSNLSRHQKTSKKCKSIPEDTKITYDCEFCTKNFTSSLRLMGHMDICMCKKIINEKMKEKEVEHAKQIKEMEIEYAKQIKEKEVEFKEEKKISLNYYNTTISLNTEIAVLKSQLRILKINEEKQAIKITNLEDRIERMATKSIEKTTTTNITTATTNNNTVNFFTQEYITEQVNSKFDRDLLIQGIQGVAKFTYEHISKEGDRPAYVCTDPSRQVFNYMSADGKVTRDYKGMKLIKILQKPIKDRSFKLIKDAEYAIDYLKDVEKRDENENKELSLYRFAVERWGEIRVDMTSLDKSSFVSELTKLVTV